MNIIKLKIVGKRNRRCFHIVAEPYSRINGYRKERVKLGYWNREHGDLKVDMQMLNYFLSRGYLISLKLFVSLKKRYNLDNKFCKHKNKLVIYSV